MGASKGPLELSWAPLGTSWGPPGAEGPNCRFVFPLLGPSWSRLGTFLGDLRRILGRYGALLDRLRTFLGGLLGRLGAVFEASWSVLERRKHEKGKTPETSKNSMKINDFGLLEAPWEASWSALGVSWRPLGPSWGHLGRLGALWGRLGSLLGRLGSFLDRSGPVPAQFGVKNSVRTPSGYAQVTPRAPGRGGVPLMKHYNWRWYRKLQHEN